MADQFIGQVLAEKYRIDSLIGEDNLGNFYHGTHLLMEKPVAVKVLSPALAVDESIVKRFAAEARAVSRISHPNILNVTDYGSDKSGAVFIVYEDIKGETLEDVIERAGKFPLERADHILKQAASALSAAHSNGVVHRNLMSENILIRRTPSDAEEVKIFNFYVEADDELDNQSDYLAEKAKYTSPEMINTPTEVDERTDVYSLGIILYEMLAGEVPFSAENTTELLLKQAQEMPPSILTFRYDLPDETDEVLLKALAKKPDLRYQSVNSLADSVNRLTFLSGKRQAMAAAAAAESAPTNNNIWKTAFIVLVGICLISGFFIYMTNAGKQTNPSTQLQTDPNGVPVQPLNPSTGSNEQVYSNMNTFSYDAAGNSNMTMTNQEIDYGNPWASGKTPVGPPPVGPYGPYPTNTGNTGATGTIPPCTQGSVFMDCITPTPTPGNTAIINKPVNKPTNANVNTQSTPAANTVKPTPTPAANTTAPQDKPTPKPKATATPKPNSPPAATDKRPASGKQQDSN